MVSGEGKGLVVLLCRYEGPALKVKHKRQHRSVLGLVYLLFKVLATNYLLLVLEGDFFVI